MEKNDVTTLAFMNSQSEGSDEMAVSATIINVMKEKTKHACQSINHQKKRKLSEIVEVDEEYSLTKQPKLIVPTAESFDDEAIVIFPPSIFSITTDFLAVLNAEYGTLEFSSDSSDESDHTYSQHTPREYIGFYLTLPSFPEISLNASSVEFIYQAVAEKLIKEESVITLMEYLLSQHYDWNTKGNMQETLLHYLITLPDSMLAMDKFDIDTQVKLLTKYYDNKGNSPLIVLAKIYIATFNIEIYKNLKNCFDIILDFSYLSNYLTFTNTCISNSHRSAFEIILDYSDRAFEQDESILNNYLEILALMCVRTVGKAKNYQLVKRFFDGLEIQQIHYKIFDQYYHHYDKVLLANEIEFNQVQSGTHHKLTLVNHPYSFLNKVNITNEVTTSREQVVSNTECLPSFNSKF